MVASPCRDCMAIRFLDLFAGAGGLSEGFMLAGGYTPVAHVEMDAAACNTLRTRAAYRWLVENGQKDLYVRYLRGKITRKELYAAVPSSELATVIEAPIGRETNLDIFRRIDDLNKGQQVDLILGGPPCQAYSLVGRSRVGDTIRTDERNYLFRYYVEFLKKYKPKYFVFENVTGLFSAKDEAGNKFYDQVIAAFDEVNYRAFPRLVKAEEYGVPQSRHRVIIVGCRKKDAKNGNISITPAGECPVTINEIFADLKALQGGEGDIYSDGRNGISSTAPWLSSVGIADADCPVTFHQARPVWEHDRYIYKKVVEAWNEPIPRRFNYATDLPKELQTHRNIKSFTDRFKVVDGKAHASHTVVAHIQKDGHYYIHPDIRQNRSLSPREAARLQTFPDNYFFEGVSDKGSRTSAYRQIGNAVPVLLAKQIAEELKNKFRLL